MITCQLSGGLGNQMFQICATIAFALSCNQAFCFPRVTKTEGITKRSTYWDSFFSALQPFSKNISLQGFIITREYRFEYNPFTSDPSVFSKNQVLVGYFQSYKYFDSHITSIMRLIKFDKQVEEWRQRWSLHMSCTNSISMHFRHGDYNQLLDTHPILPVIYYKKAVETILQNAKYPSLIKQVWVFCEKNAKGSVEPMVEQLVEWYPELTFTFVDESMSDAEQWIAMSECMYHIMANSTFGWWGAYFASKRYPYAHIVCYPELWFGPKKLYVSTEDLFPPSFIKTAIA